MFETEVDRDAFRGEVARVLGERQLDRLTSGDADALEQVLEDRLDRFYAAKVYLQSDAATANSEALRKVVDELADTEYEKHRAPDTLVGGSQLMRRPLAFFERPIGMGKPDANEEGDHASDRLERADFDVAIHRGNMPAYVHRDLMRWIRRIQHILTSFCEESDTSALLMGDIIALRVHRCCA